MSNTYQDSNLFDSKALTPPFLTPSNSGRSYLKTFASFSHDSPAPLGFCSETKTRQRI